MQINKEDLIKALVDEYLIREDEPTTHYHCGNCSCSGCRHATEDCTCTSDKLKEIIERLSYE